MFDVFNRESPLFYLSSKVEAFFKNLVSFGLYIFLCGVYVFTDGSDVTRVFYVSVLLPSLVLVCFYFRVFPFKNLIFLIFLVFPLYLSISFLWADGECITKNFIFHLRNFFCTFLYFFALWIAIKKDRKFTQKLLWVLFISGFFSSLVSLFVYFQEYGLESNVALMDPFTDNPNKAGAIFSIHFCLVLYQLRNIFFEKGHILNVLLSIALIADLIVVFLTQAWIPWLVICAFIVWIILKEQKMRVWVVVISFLLLCSFAGFFLNFDNIKNMTRVDVRAQLIEKAIEQMDGRYLIGIGLRYKFPLEINSVKGVHPHPHNIFIDVFRFGGVIGLLFMLLQCGSFLYSGLKSAQIDDNLSFVLFWFLAGFLLMSFYSQQPLTRPGGYIWFLYWMPGTILAVHWLLVKEEQLDSSRLNG